MYLVCNECGQEFPRKKFGPPAKFCDASCKARYHSARYKQDGRGDRYAAISHERREAKKPPMPACEVCGVVMENRRRKQCGSDECLREYKHRVYWSKREWYREWWKEYSAANPELVAANKAKHNRIRRARRQDAPTDGTGPREWAVLMEDQDNWCCGLCGGGFRAGDEMHWDHIDPLSTGSLGNVVQNMQPAHGSCNVSRQTTTIDIWRKRVGIPDYV